MFLLGTISTRGGRKEAYWYNCALFFKLISRVLQFYLTMAVPTSKGRPSVANKVAIVTGGGQGLGRAHAPLLAERGAKVVVMSRLTSINKAESVCKEIRDLGGEALAVGRLVGNDDDFLCIFAWLF